MAASAQKSSMPRRHDSSETARPVGFESTTARPPANLEEEPKHGVLLVEDDLALSKSLVRSLGAAGVEVTTVTDGAEALEKLLKGGYEVVLSDIHLPGMSGIELLRVVDSYELDVPVILMTGQPEVETAVEALDRGALTYLRKPTPMPDILGAIERARERTRQNRARREAEKVLGLDDAGARSNATRSSARRRTRCSSSTSTRTISSIPSSSTARARSRRSPIARCSSSSSAPISRRSTTCTRA